MSFSENDGNGFYMPVAPAYGGSNGGFGGCWGSDVWLILIILFAFGGFGGYGMGGFGGGMGYDFPWLLNGQQGINANTNAGFNQAATQSAINGIQNSITSGFGDVQLGIAGVNQNICQTGNGIVNALNSGFNSAEIGANARQMANMNQIYGLSSQLAQCCCDNQLATANVRADVARESCATRTADVQNTQSILNAINGGIQSIKDQICNDKIDAKNEKIVELQNQLNMATLRESQTSQNALITQGFSNEVDALYNRLNSCPVPTTPVYGRTPIFTCGNGGMYGCGCGA